GLFTIVFGPIAFIVIILFGYKYYKRNQQKGTAKTTNVRYVQEERKVQETNNIEDTIIVEDNVVEESVFFDLNENERIEKRLSEIWNKYNGKINTQIINRKPIFSADGVNDSILFVGINPSYNPS